MPFKRDDNGVVVIQPGARKTLESWASDVVGNWVVQWKDKDHPYSRLSTFLGERFLTDFDMRHYEERAKR